MSSEIALGDWVSVTAGGASGKEAKMVLDIKLIEHAILMNETFLSFIKFINTCFKLSKSII